MTNIQSFYFSIGVSPKSGVVKKWKRQLSCSTESGATTLGKCDAATWDLHKNPLNQLYLLNIQLTENDFNPSMKILKKHELNSIRNIIDIQRKTQQTIFIFFRDLK